MVLLTLCSENKQTEAGSNTDMAKGSCPELKHAVVTPLCTDSWVLASVVQSHCQDTWMKISSSLNPLKEIKDDSSG